MQKKLLLRMGMLDLCVQSSSIWDCAERTSAVPPAGAETLPLPWMHRVTLQLLLHKSEAEEGMICSVEVLMIC